MKPRILLLSPTFHGYAQSIARGFECEGYDVTLHEYDKLSGVRAKIGHKLRNELPAKVGLKANDGVRAGKVTADLIRQVHPDIALVIRGDGMDPEVHDALASVPAHRYLWLWDEVRRSHHTEEDFSRYDHLISYSPADTAALEARGRGCLHVANAFDHTMVPTSSRQTNRALFIGARYPRREQLLTDAASLGAPILTVGRGWSHHPFDRLRTWEWTRPDIPALRDIPREEGYALTAGAPGAINIHFDQDGFTMKTFEVPGVGGVQLVDRADVSEFYEPGTEVLVFETAPELAELVNRCIHDDRWADGIRQAGQKRTLAENTFAHRARRIATLWA